MKTTDDLRWEQWTPPTVVGTRTDGVTASIITGKRNQGARVIGAYIGVAPIDAPKYAVTVMLLRDGVRPLSDHPTATIFARVMRAVFLAYKKAAS